MESLRVLVVDDKKSAADTLALFFRLEGYEVETAYDGEQAVRVALKSPFDLILMDLAMPRLDGYGAARQIIAQSGRPLPRMVALSGWSQDEVVSKAQEAGFVRHLVKPVSPDHLRELLEQLGLTPVS